MEYDNHNIYGSTLWDIMVIANYSFTDWVTATLRYSHEDNEVSALNYESANRYTLAFLFTLTDNLYFNFEYSHAQRELLGGGDDDLNELYLEALLSILTLTNFLTLPVFRQGFFWSSLQLSCHSNLISAWIKPFIQNEFNRGKSIRQIRQISPQEN